MAVVGINGSGKSTLLKMIIAGHVKSSSGVFQVGNSISMHHIGSAGKFFDFG